MRINIIAAVTDDNAIGYKGGLIHADMQDLNNFKRLTTGTRVVMGRRTFESLPNGALPNRENIVVSTNKQLQLEDATVVTSLKDAVAHATTDIYIIGGASIYKEALATLDINTVYLTRFDFIAEKADAYFPVFKGWKLLYSMTHSTVYKGENKHMYFQAYTPNK